MLSKKEPSRSGCFSCVATNSKKYIIEVINDELVLLSLPTATLSAESLQLLRSLLSKQGEAIAARSLLEDVDDVGVGA